MSDTIAAALHEVDCKPNGLGLHEAGDPYSSCRYTADALTAKGWALVNQDTLAAALRTVDPDDDGNAPIRLAEALPYFARKAGTILEAIR